MSLNRFLLSFDQQPIATGLAALLALTGGVVTAPRTAGAAEIPEIVVTVRERAESLKDVPGTVSVLTDKQIEASGIERARDFIALTPGVSIVNAAEVGDSQVNIRGMNGARDAEANYALIIDGILMTNPAALNREYLNLKQIEILKGPQGALYGRNAAAGAIVITTNTPGDKFAGDVKASFAEDNTFGLAGNVGGPVTDTLRWSAFADWKKSDGYYTNSYFKAIGKDEHAVDYSEEYSFGGRLLWDPTDKISLDGKIRYGNVDAGAITFNSVFHLPAFAQFLGNPDFAEDVNNHADKFLFTPNIKPFNSQEAFEVSLKETYDLGGIELTAWGLYSDIRNNFGADGTSGAFGFFNTEPNCVASTAALTGFPILSPQFIGQNPNPASGTNPTGSLFGAYTPTTCDGTQFQKRNESDYSFEVRLASKGPDPFKWLAGVYYLNIDREVGVNLGIDTGQGILKTLYTADPRNPTEQLVDDQFGTDVYSVFGQLAYDFPQGVEVAAALRYDSEHRNVRNLVPINAVTQYLTCTGPPFVGGSPINPGLCQNPGGIPPQSKTFNQVEPKASVRWDVTDNFTAFTSVGVGFKSGGFNSQGSKATIDTFINGLAVAGTGFSPVVVNDDFRKETSVAYELGQKSNFFGNRVRTELAYYHTDVTDMQFFEFFVGPFGLLRVVSNIDRVRIDGVEGSANWLATDWLSLGVGANWTNSKVEKNTARPDTVGNRSPYTPTWTATGSVNFSWPLTHALNFIANADVSAIGPTWFSVVQNQQRPTIFGAPGDYSLTRRDAYALLNLRVGVDGGNWSVVAFGKNASDTRYLEEVIPAPEFGGSFIHAGTESRFGVEGTYRF